VVIDSERCAKFHDGLKPSRANDASAVTRAVAGVLGVRLLDREDRLSCKRFYSKLLRVHAGALEAILYAMQNSHDWDLDVLIKFSKNMP
jgi:hypothetical protein